MTKRAEHFLLTGLNYVNFNRLSPSYEDRLAKYMCRGVGVKIPSFLSTTKEIYTINCIYCDSQDDLEREEYQHDMSDRHFIFRSVGIVREKCDIPYMYKFDKNLINIPELEQFVTKYVMDTNIFTTRIFNIDLYTLKGIDRLLFHYIKNMKYEYNRNDFEVTFTSDYCISNVVKQYIRDNIYTSGITNSKTTHYIGSDSDIESVLNIDDYDQLSEKHAWLLPQKIEWKITNPGEQMTGTFHKTVLEDNSTWYRGKFYML